MSDAEIIEFNNKVFAMVIRAGINPEETKFYTSKNNSLQMGIIKHKEGYVEPPHTHLHKERIIRDTQETLQVIQGLVKVNFYEIDGKKVGEVLLRSGDVILLIDGGHAIEVLENLKAIKVKQGPYMSIEDDKKFLGGNR